MKTLFIVLVLFVGSSPILLAQEEAVAKIHYIFKHVNDTSQRDKYLRDEVVTYLGQSSSYYSSYSSTRAQEEVQKQMSDPSFDGHLKISRSTTPVRESYLLDASNQVAQEIRQVGGDSFLLDCEFPTQDWEIADETKVIGGYTAQKAIARFKGRDYTAWFTTELPFHAGPWKLNGLPGLILEAYDTDKEVVFEYSGFDKMEDVALFVAAPNKSMKSTEKEVAKLAEAFRANPQAYMEAKREGAVSTGTSGTVTIIGSASPSTKTVGSPQSSATSLDASKIKSMSVNSDDNYKPSQNTNNPIELMP